MKKMILFIAVILFSLSVFSVSMNDLRTEFHKGESNWDNFYDLLLEAPAEMANGTVLPSEAAVVVEGEIVNLNFEGKELHIVSFKVKNNTIINAMEGTSSNATMLVGIKSPTVKKIIYSQDMLTSFLEAKNSGEIIIKPIGLIPTIKTTIGNIISGILGLFG
ncbi:MAG: hypothetical protein JW703_04235 [Candidatus Diapherotrites archaeon]|nr:hypothetical protein [Candidatus Diapherotrites archaeon]